MHLNDIPFGITGWQHIEPTQHAGEAGVSRWRTQQFGTVRVRLVEYSARSIALAPLDFLFPITWPR